MKKFYAITNLLVVIGLIYWNYYVNVNGINGNTVGSLSDQYDNLFTPANYAFSIWGLIFLGLLALCIFQVKKVFFDKKDDHFVLLIGPLLIIANVANVLWLDLWLNEMTGTFSFHHVWDFDFIVNDNNQIKHAIVEGTACDDDLGLVADFAL